jgi:hypothetical protein
MEKQDGTWTDAISNDTVCGLFYVFYVVYAILAAIAVLAVIAFIATSKAPMGQLIFQSFTVLFSAALSATIALFLYLLCERALKPAAGESLNAKLVQLYRDLRR